MSPALNGSSVIQHFEHSDAIKIHDGMIFDFYMRLPHIIHFQEVMQFEERKETLVLYAQNPPSYREGGYI